MLGHIEKRLSDQTELSWFNLHYRRFVETLEVLTQYLPSPASVLDIGCWPGHLTIAIKHLGYEVSGVDVAPDRFKELMTRERITIKECNLEEAALPFSDETFDCALLTEVIEHLSPRQVSRVLSLIWRVIKINGTLILSTPNIASLDNRTLLLFGKEILIKEHDREYTMNEVEDLLKEAGFEIVKRWYSMARDVVTHAIPEEYISPEHVLYGFIKYPYWKNFGRAVTLPVKMMKSSFRSTIFVVAKK